MDSIELILKSAFLLIIKLETINLRLHAGVLIGTLLIHSQLPLLTFYFRHGIQDEACGE